MAQSPERVGDGDSAFGTVNDQLPISILEFPPCARQRRWCFCWQWRRKLWRRCRQRAVRQDPQAVYEPRRPWDYLSALPGRHFEGCDGADGLHFVADAGLHHPVVVLIQMPLVVSLDLAVLMFKQTARPFGVFRRSDEQRSAFGDFDGYAIPVPEKGGNLPLDAHLLLNIGRARPAVVGGEFLADFADESRAVAIARGLCVCREGFAFSHLDRMRGLRGSYGDRLTLDVGGAHTDYGREASRGLAKGGCQIVVI